MVGGEEDAGFTSSDGACTIILLILGAFLISKLDGVAAVLEWPAVRRTPALILINELVRSLS